MDIDGILNRLYKWSKESVIDEILIFAALIAFIETFAQNKLRGDSVLIGLIFYALVGYVLHFAYHKFPLGKMNVIWSSISIILATALGYVLYNEPLNSWKILSLISALFAIYFASKSG
jgi:multidrug transporter EmrE-like cation transporter